MAKYEVFVMVIRYSSDPEGRAKLRKSLSASLATTA